MKNKKKADGFCGVCGNEVPPTNLNLFYCSEKCRRQAWRYFHPNQEEPDWDFLYTIHNL